MVELCAVLGGIALVLGQKAATQEEGEGSIRKLLADGRGAAKLRELIEAQGGNPTVFDDPSLLPTAPLVHTISSPADGYIVRLEALRIAHVATALGAGRGEAGAAPDPAVGVYLLKKTRDGVSEGEPIAEIHARDEASAQTASELALSAYDFGPKPPDLRPLVHEIVR